MDKAKTIPEHIEGLMQGLGRYEPRVIETEGWCPACGQDDCEEGCLMLNSLSSKDLKGRGAGLKKDLTPKAGRVA